MSNTPSNMLALGTKAPDFQLPNPSNNNQLQALESLKGKKGTLVIFMCNHCPFVLHVNNELVRLANDYQSKQISFVAISANDVITHPDDAPDKMKATALQMKYPFPYLYDETQEVAKAYDAACTPDFFIYNKNMQLVYRGQLDDSRPGNGIEVSGKDMRNALDCLLTYQPVSAEQRPSIGCNIKWKQ